MRDDSFLLLFNAHHEPISFRLPAYGTGRWLALVDTAREDGLARDGEFAAGVTYPVEGRSLVLLQRIRDTVPAAGELAAEAQAIELAT